MKKGDKFIINIVILIFIVSIFSFFYFKNYKSDGNLIAVIEKEGKVVEKINLNTVKKEKKIKINYNKNNYNIIIVQNGRIKFKEANCHDKVCIRAGWLSKKGDIAVCLPHRIVIKILGEKPEIDEVTY